MESHLLLLDQTQAMRTGEVSTADPEFAMADLPVTSARCNGDPDRCCRETLSRFCCCLSRLAILRLHMLLGLRWTANCAACLARRPYVVVASAANAAVLVVAVEGAVGAVVVVVL